MTEQKPSDEATSQVVSKPRKVRLPGFVQEQDIGLGDALEAFTAAWGIKPCGGCKQRAAAMNRWMVFTK